MGTNQAAIEWDDDVPVYHYYIYSMKFVTKKTAKAEEAAEKAAQAAK